MVGINKMKTNNLSFEIFKNLNIPAKKTNAHKKLKKK
jgi:hypothetical protein